MPAKSDFRLHGRNRDSYLKLVLEFPLAPISSEAQLDKAQEMIDRLLGAGPLDHGQEMYLDVLSDLAAVYEDEHHPIPAASDADMLRHLMEAKGITQAQLNRDTSIAKSTISEILSGKKNFTRPIIHKFAEYFEVDATVLAANF